ncbi:putative Ig domain-containing protein [uncultured Zobellia sp.]|uniref:putative Ig domain-containing protein n=1 Tax=uncultured Zobellia sp. TaxID=255433 RepID=UPI0025959EC5|nr:putative Ig domain-containing protein [uncultured Zobellia sp.]
MIKTILPFFFIVALMSCKSSTELTSYFGQKYPGAIPEIFAPDVISVKNRFEHGISFTPNTNELAFGILDKNGVRGEIYYSKKDNDTWSDPRTFKPLENRSVFLPYFTPDGQALLYAQSIPDTNNLYITNIGRVKKVDNHWGLPEKLETPISSASREASASMTMDGTLYFSSNRNCQGKENCFTADLFFSKILDKKYQSVSEIADLNSANDEESVFISPNETYLIFCRYTNGETFVDLYISYRNHNGNWTSPQILDPTINSKDWDRRPFVSADNKYLFFTRLQIASNGLAESDIYWSNTSKVFHPFVYHPLEAITIRKGENFELQLPPDYFKDMDDTQLVLNTTKTKLNWLNFDNETMTLSGRPTLDGEFELIFTATDKALNSTEDRLKITVTQ